MKLKHNSNLPTSSRLHSMSFRYRTSLKPKNLATLPSEPAAHTTLSLDTLNA